MVGNRKLFRFSINVLSVITLVAMVTLVFVNVVLRYLFDSGLAWSEEVSRITFVWLVFIGIVIAYQENEHLAVDVFTSRFKGGVAQIIGVISKLVSVFILIACSIGGIKLMILTHSQGLPSTGFPTSIIYLAGVLSCLVCSFIIVFLSRSKRKEGDSV